LCALVTTSGKDRVIAIREGERERVGGKNTWGGGEKSIRIAPIPPDGVKEALGRSN